MIRAEVAALVQEIIDDVLAQTLHNISQGRELAANIAQYLDGDTSWVELYCATGELLIPSTVETREGLRGLFTSLQQVLYVAAIRRAPIHFIFTEAGAQQTARGVTIPVEGNQDPSGYSTDERWSDRFSNCERVNSRRSIPDYRCRTYQNSH